jgi:hypothetical protein
MSRRTLEKIAAALSIAGFLLLAAYALAAYASLPTAPH